MTKREPVDMSPAALQKRLDQVRALYDLMRYLGKAEVAPPNRR